MFVNDKSSWEKKIYQKPNFESDHLVILYYPAWAGGKFLANCIGISDGAVLQDRQLASRQLQNQLTSQEKYDILLDRLNNTNEVWTDLNLGCHNFFGVYNQEYLYKENFHHNHFSDASVAVSTQNQKYFFLVEQSPILMANCLKIWPNAKVIVFEHCLDFLWWRNYSTPIQRYWNKIRDDSWPLDAPDSVESALALPPFMLEEFHSRSDGDIWQYLLEKPKLENVLKTYDTREFDHRVIYRWDCRNNFDNDRVLESVKELYDLLGLTDFNINHHLIRKFHDSWIKKLIEIRKQSVL